MAYTKEERERNKSILVATLNYLLEYHANDMVFDDYSPSKQWYLQELKRTELDIQNSQSKQIEKRLDRHIDMIKHRANSNFNKYVKFHTGYDINFFEELKSNIIPILEKNKIEANDIYHIQRFLKVYNEDAAEHDTVVVLNDLLKKHNAKMEAEIASLVGLGDVVETVYCINDKQMSEAEYKTYLHKWQLSKETSPNGLNSVSVEFSGTGEHALTYVVILLSAGSGTLYCAKGEKLPIKAYWKDKNTVVIETKEVYSCHDKYHQVSSYDEVYKIEYRYI